MLFTTNKEIFNSKSDAVFLEKVNWNDYSYRTKFNVHLRYKGECKVLGEVKIMSSHMDDNSDLSNPKKNVSPIIDETFEKLGGEFYSLGQELEYYRNLSKLNRDLGDELLKGIRDCATFIKPEDGIREHKAFWDSLTRGSEAKKCLKEGGDYYFKKSKRTKISFDYAGKVFDESNSFLSFEFDRVSDLPSTINVIIGRNGSGKTRLLSKLSEDIVMNNDDSVFLPERPLISRVVAISYSAFDNFRIPTFGAGSEGNDYRYIGIRKRLEGEDGDAIKSSDDHWNDISIAIDEIEDENLLGEIEKFIETSAFDGVVNIKDRKALKPIFSRMSSGQKISLSIICQLAAFLEDDSLVLFDEPENHLHPGLLWSMMVSFDRVLKKKRSYSIIATHSPIILQQVPSNYVNVVYRNGSVVSADKIKSETFGENLQAIMEKAFGFVEPEHDYRDIFRFLKKDKKLGKSEIEALFSKELGLQARVFLSTMFKNEKND